MQEQILQRQTLYTVAIKEDNRANAWARNILIARDTLEYSEPVLLPGYLKSSTVIPISAKEKIRENRLIVYPNPSNNYFIVRYELKEQNKKGMIILIDISGRIVKSYETDRTEDYIIIPAKQLTKGNYLIKLIINDFESGVQKVTVQ